MAQVEPEGEGEGEAEPEDFSELDLDPAKLQLEIPDTAPCGKTLSLPHFSVVQKRADLEVHHLQSCYL